MRFRRPLPRFSRSELHEGQGLHGLAQAHLVGQDAAEPVVAQEVQVAQTLDLVGPQRGGEPLGRVERRISLKLPIFSLSFTK